MKKETKICQNCKKDFTIESDDFSFYEKIKVPSPTFCPECRLVRRMAFRNERVLFKRICDLCNKNIIAMYPANALFPVYCRECWYGDEWDSTIYGQDYDFSRPFFEQYKELSNKVPRFALWQRNAINSEYSNMVAESKNVYLSASTVGSENVFYSKITDKSTDIVDCMSVKEGQDLYENINCDKNYNCQYMLLSRNCLDSYFLIDCVNCSNCVLSYNLQNKEFYIRNIKYEREDYFRELEKLNLVSLKSRKILVREFNEMRSKALYRFANIIRSVNSTGNNLTSVKNSLYSFDSYDSENLKYCYRLISFKDSMDTTLGIKSELIYEYITGILNGYNVKFSNSSINSVQDAEYTEYCMDAKNLFGCIAVKNKECVILNKVYSKEEFESLRAKIIKHMEEMPFLDKADRVYKYGEFFPIEFSPWGYNETLAQEIASLTKNEVIKAGYEWSDPEEKNFNITLRAENIPDTIGETDRKILNEVIACAHNAECNHLCTTAFRVTQYEFQFYKKHNIPIPGLCSNCRYYNRLAMVPSLQLWQRSCACKERNHFHADKKCEIRFSTPYAPERPEIIYCEKCYQSEVY